MNLRKVNRRLVPAGQLGVGDATYQAVGGEQGIRVLVDTFYEIMATNADYQTIWSWHPDDNTNSRDKLARFLCGWMGGPRRYQEKYGPINIPAVHAHLKVTEVERDQWLGCMAQALAHHNHEPNLIRYLLEQFAAPAERIRQMSAQHRQPLAGGG